jgi:hypothetical protein
MPPHLRSDGLSRTGFAIAALLVLVLSTAARAQGTGGPSTRDSSVGYIDSAIPGDQFRLRVDAAQNDDRPNRAEFFYAQGHPLGPGLPQPDPRVNYEDATQYLEVAASERLSAFVELAQRFLQPEVNAAHNGLGDMNAGFKYAFLYSSDLVTTFQLRTYIPTGDATRGLGTNHVSLEPALLVYKPLSERLGFEGEFRTWVPVGGTDFAGDVVRYGLGLHYDLYQTENTHILPVVEFIGWTVLGGKETVVEPTGVPIVQSAAGATIFDIKVGVHVKIATWGDLYTGYGRTVTGSRWYEDIYRAELRLFF